MGKNIHETLKPGGRLVIFRATDDGPAYQRNAEILAPHGFALQKHDHEASTNREWLIFRKVKRPDAGSEAGPDRG